METIFKSLFESGTTNSLEPEHFVLCIIASLVIGLIIALMYMYKNESSRSFVMTLAVLPAIVCVIIMMVNGNVGAGVATAGAFSLVRFRSLPGTAKEIGVIFLAMGAGLVTGMGYIAYGFLFAIVLGAVWMLYTQTGFGGKSQSGQKRTLRVTIPEDLDYTEIFDDIFEKYASDSELVSVKTTNMGSLFRLTYNLTLKDIGTEKAMIDEIRCRNGNLEIIASKQETAVSAEL